MSAEKYAQWIVDNQDKQGTPEFETVAQAYKAAREQASPAPTLKQKITASVPGRVLQGLRDPIDAGAQLLPRGLEFATSAGGLAPNAVSNFFGQEAQKVDTGIAQAEREYQQSRQATGSSGMDLARIGGNIASPANLAIASRLPAAATTSGRVVTGGLLGATGGAMQPVNVEENPDFASTKLGQVVLGGVTGGVMTPILGKVGDFVARQIAKASPAKPIVLTKTTEEFARSSGLDWEVLGQSERAALQKQVVDAARASAGKDPKVLARIQDFKAEDVPYTLGQITRDPRQFATEKNLSQLPGVGDPLLERFSSQGAILRDKMSRFSAGAADEQQTGRVLSDALKGYDDKLAGEVRTMYTQARNSAGKDAEVPLQGLAQDFADVLDTFGDKVPSGVRQNFAKFGLGTDGAGTTQRKLFTVEEADKLLKVINANRSNDPAANAALDALRQSVKKAITQDAGVDDVFSAARKAAASRFSLQEAVPALEAAASGRANPDTFVQNFVLSKSARGDQVKRMAEVLKQENPEAFSAARAQIGAYLNRKAFGENKAGDKLLAPERFSSALREIGEAKLSAFFSKSEIEQMQRISRISAYMESVPYAAKPNTSGNWGAIVSRFPGVPAAIATADSLRAGVSNQLNVSRALSAKPPTNLSPEQVAFISKVLGVGALSSGASAAQGLN